MPLNWPVRALVVSLVRMTAFVLLLVEKAATGGGELVGPREKDGASGLTVAAIGTTVGWVGATGGEIGRGVGGEGGAEEEGEGEGKGEEGGKHFVVRLRRCSSFG